MHLQSCSSVVFPLIMRGQNNIGVMRRKFSNVSFYRKGQQYDCKWYLPLADLTFQTIEDSESSPIPLVQEEEIDAMKIKISQIKNDIQREKVKLKKKKKD